MCVCPHVSDKLPACRRCASISDKVRLKDCSPLSSTPFRRWLQKSLLLWLLQWHTPLWHHTAHWNTRTMTENQPQHRLNPSLNKNQLQSTNHLVQMEGKELTWYKPFSLFRGEMNSRNRDSLAKNCAAVLPCLCFVPNGDGNVAACTVTNDINTYWCCQFVTYVAEALIAEELVTGHGNGGLAICSPERERRETVQTWSDGGSQQLQDKLQGCNTHVTMTICIFYSTLGETVADMFQIY